MHELSHDQPKTMKELLDITTWHTSHEEAVDAVLIQGNGKAVPGDGRGAPPKVVGNDAKKSAKGNKKRPKWRPQRVITMTNDDEGDNDKEVDDSMRKLSLPLSGISSSKHDSLLITLRNFLRQPSPSLHTLSGTSLKNAL
jgi:hypothetical protein